MASVCGVWWVLAAAVGTGALVVVLDGATTSLPTAEGGAQVPVWRVLSVLPGSLPVAVLASRLDALDAVAAQRFARSRLVCLAVTCAASAAALLLAVVVLGRLDLVPVVGRALLAWAGLALLSGRLLGWRAGWVLPWAGLAALVYWGYPTGGPRWFEVAARPADDPATWALALALLAVGLVALAATPWRRAALRRGTGWSRDCCRG